MSPIEPAVWPPTRADACTTALYTCLRSVRELGAPVRSVLEKQRRRQGSPWEEDGDEHGINPFARSLHTKATFSGSSFRSALPSAPSVALRTLPQESAGPAEPPGAGAAAGAGALPVRGPSSPGVGT